MIFQNGVNLRADCENCFSNMRCVLQSSEEMLAPMVETMAQQDSQTTGFVDANPGVSIGQHVQPMDIDLADAVTSAGLSEFLSRPVRIFSASWSQSDPETIWNTITPWSLFFNNASIKNKLQNFSFLRADLKIKVVVNASPFYYGSMRACYQPLTGFKPSTIQFTSNLGAAIPFSQQPGLWIVPQHSEGAEMTLPFLYPRSFLRVQSLSDFTNMGTINFYIYNALQSANGAIGQSVQVQVYAWAENVTLAGPSVGAALQCKEELVAQADEYGVGAVSGPASALALAAHKLTSIPSISRFAKATEIGASAVSNVAKLFGFTNVPVIADTEPIRNSPFPQLASSDIGYVSEKLALDPKNELSIDPSIVGIGSEDELAIANFATRESYLTYATWSTSTTVDSSLFASKVKPQLGFRGTYGTAIVPFYQFVPMGLTASMFRCWRGDIIFRFRFIASPFHKGRVRISYDPFNSGVQSTGDTGPTVFNKIVDLGAETDVEFRVPYQQALAWCYTTPLPISGEWVTNGTPSIPYADTFDNGIISVKVLTTLSAPVATSTVAMQVFVRAADNIEYANPATGFIDASPFQAQSKEYSEQTDVTLLEPSSPPDVSGHRNLVNFGESVASLRTLLRRYNLLDTIYVPTQTASTSGVYYVQQTRFPAYYGFDPSGWNTAKGVNTPASNFNFNFLATSPWHLVANCFVGQRGSMNWIYNPSKGSLGIVSRVVRNNTAFAGYANNYQVGPNTNSNIIEANYWKNSSYTVAGSSLTHTNTTNGHAVTAPSYSVFKFQTTDPASMTNPGGPTAANYDGTVYDTLRIEYPCDASSNPIGGMTIERYFGIGTDYTLHFFLNCPTLSYLSPSSIVPV